MPAAASVKRSGRIQTSIDADDVTIDAKPISASTTVALTVTLDEPVTLGTLILGSGSPGVG